MIGVLIEKTGTLDQPFRFSTKRYDEETGLSYYGYRFYSASLGRWMTRDPLGEAGGMNLYGFVGNNAINGIDPLGLWRNNGHSELTIIAMTSFTGSFSGADIVNVINANLEVDNGVSNQLNNAAHYMPGTQGTAELIINAALREAIQLELAGQHNAALTALGAGLHTLQDRYAHFEQDAGWSEHISSQPDNPAIHPNEYANAGNASINFINRFLQGVNVNRCRP